MELLLNLAWALLALPAYWLWRRAAGPRKRLGWQSLLTLGCGLVLLFPVISASDDLHAMRAEMEDSSISKRTVRQASSDKHSAWVNRLQGSASLAGSSAWLVLPRVELVEISVPRVAPLARLSAVDAGRAPPVSLLG